MHSTATALAISQPPYGEVDLELRHEELSTSQKIVALEVCILCPWIVSSLTNVDISPKIRRMQIDTGAYIQYFVACGTVLDRREESALAHMHQRLQTSVQGCSQH